jgi:hypothetical protein
MAAGLGFKTFTTGEVLTAADTNGYLMQGVLVFASAAARDAAITSPQEGQCCYLKDTDAVQTYSGSAWVGFDDSNAIQNSIVDAKGDIVAASGNDTPARLAVGNNGDTLVADSSTTTGLRYQEPKANNPVLNSAFQVWQRGTSVAISASSGGYTADRWTASTGANGASTISRQVTNDTTNLPNIQYCARVQKNSGQTGTAGFAFYQSFETINSIPFAGKTVTVSFYARKGANYSQASSQLTFQLLSGTGTDQSILSGYTGLAIPLQSNVTLTTTWQRFSVTGTIATTATEFAVGFEYTPVGTAGAADYYEVTGVQLEVGSVATPFKTYAGTIQGELAACQRYYYRLTADTTYAYLAFGMATSTTNGKVSVPAPSTMRVVPTAIDSPTASTLRFTDGVSGTTCNASPTLDADTTNELLTFNVGVASGLTQYRPIWFGANNSSSAYIGFSAEL